MALKFDEKKGTGETLPEKKAANAVMAMDKAALMARCPEEEILADVDDPELGIIKINKDPMGFVIDGEIAKSITGFVLVPQRQNFYWKGKYTGESVQPDCFSRDAIKPDASVEDPQSELCGTCPLNQYGSKLVDGKPSKGKACNNTRVILFLRDGDRLPSMIRCSATNIKPWRKFASACKKTGNHWRLMRVEISLTEKQYANGPYPYMNFTEVEKLNLDDPADLAVGNKVVQFAETYLEAAQRSTATQEEATETDLF